MAEEKSGDKSENNVNVGSSNVWKPVEERLLSPDHRKALENIRSAAINMAKNIDVLLKLES